MFTVVLYTCLLLLACTLAFITYHICCHLYQLIKYRHIPGVSQLLPNAMGRIPLLAPHFYFGNIKHIEHLCFKVFAKEPLFKIVAGNTTYLYVNSIDVMKYILANPKLFPKPVELYKPIQVYGPNIVSLAGGDHHMLHRKTVMKAFTKQQFEFLVRVTNSCTDLMLNRLPTNTTDTKNSKTIEVHRDFTDVTMAVVGMTNFGVDFGIFPPAQETNESSVASDFDSLTKQESAQFLASLNKTNFLGLILFQFVPQEYHSWFPFSLINKDIMDTKSCIQHLIQKRRAKGDNYLDLLSQLIKANDQDTDDTLTDEELISNIFIFLLAGHETTAATMGYVLYELAKRPDIQAKCLEEIRTVLGDRDFTYADYHSMTYLTNVLKELLRLHTVAAAVAKECKTDQVIGGHKVPKGSLFSLPYHAHHLREELWENPTEFNPDRHMNPSKPMSLLSFSYGTRECVGKTFSLVETMAITIRVLQKYEFQLPKGQSPDDPIKETQLITVRLSHQEIVLVPHSIVP